MTRHYLTDGVPFQFPFVATLTGVACDHKRIDTPVIVKSYAGQERHYFRVETAPGVYSIASDSKLYVDI